MPISTPSGIYPPLTSFAIYTVVTYESAYNAFARYLINQVNFHAIS